MPLWFSYQVKQDFQTSYSKRIFNKRFCKRKSSDSYMIIIEMEDILLMKVVHQKIILMENMIEKKKSEYETNSYNDSTIVEKL